VLPVTAAYSNTAEMQNVCVASHTGMNTVSVPVTDSVSKYVQFIVFVSDTMISPNTYRMLLSQATLISEELVKLITELHTTYMQVILCSILRSE